MEGGREAQVLPGVVGRSQMPITDFLTPAAYSFDRGQEFVAEDLGRYA